jgi:hypothetical protein
VAACGASRRGLIKMGPLTPPGAFSDFLVKMSTLRKSFPEMSWDAPPNILRILFSSPFFKIGTNPFLSSRSYKIIQLPYINYSYFVGSQFGGFSLPSLPSQ